MKLETHCHLIGTSVCADCSFDVMIKAYKDKGYDGIVVTNHIHRGYFSSYPGETPKEKVDYFFSVYDKFNRECSSQGIKVFLGGEVLVTCPEGHAEYIIYGFDKKFIYDHPNLFDLTQEELFKLCDKNGIFMFKAHPFRTKEVHGDPKYMHGAESFNGHYHHANNNDLAKEFCENNSLIKLSGTDFHHPDQPITAGIITKREVKDEQDLIRILRSGEYELIIEEQEYLTSHEKYVSEKK